MHFVCVQIMTLTSYLSNFLQLWILYSIFYLKSPTNFCYMLRVPFYFRFIVFICLCPMEFMSPPGCILTLMFTMNYDINLLEIYTNIIISSHLLCFPSISPHLKHTLRRPWYLSILLCVLILISDHCKSTWSVYFLVNSYRKSDNQSGSICIWSGFDGVDYW